MRRLAVALFVLAGLAAAAPAAAQFVSFTRCHGAYPCDRPFGLQYRPDPLIAGPWGADPSSAVSAHIELTKKPRVELDSASPPGDDAVDASVRYFLRRHPAPAKRSAGKDPAEAAEPAPRPPGS